MKAALSATCGDNSEEVPPVPISNTVVKLLSADDTWGVTLWEIRTSPLFFIFCFTLSYQVFRTAAAMCVIRKALFFCFELCDQTTGFVFELIQLIPCQKRNNQYVLDTENGKIVSAIMVCDFLLRPMLEISKKHLL